MQQMTLAFEPGLAERYRSLVECVAAGVYQRGLGRVAALVDVAPSHLSTQLSDGEVRKLSVDTLEQYLCKTGDLTPVHYLVDKFCRDPAVTQAEAAAHFVELMEQLLPMAVRAGFLPAGKVRPKGRAGA